MGMALLVTEKKISSEGGLARFKGSGFKKGCLLQYYSSTKFKSTITVYWNMVETSWMYCTDPVLWGFSFLRG
jgi:hypothetical protein